MHWICLVFCRGHMVSEQISAIHGASQRICWEVWLPLKLLGCWYPFLSSTRMFFISDGSKQPTSFGELPCFHPRKKNRDLPLESHEFVVKICCVSPTWQRPHCTFQRVAQISKSKSEAEACVRVFFTTFKPSCALYTIGIQSPSENGSMEPKYLPEERIIHPNHHLTKWLDP